MTQYGIREEGERSMWLKYKDNLCVEWTKEWLDAYFDWIKHSDIETDITVGATTQSKDLWADTMGPFRVYPTTHEPLRLFLTLDKVTYGYKKSDLDMEYYDQTGASEYPFPSGKDPMGGAANQSKDPWKIANTFTLSGYMESDTWRDEQPFGAIGHGLGLQSNALSLPQKLTLAQELAKKSGVQETSNPVTEFTKYCQPLTVSINWGYNYWNFNNFLKYLMDEESYTYLTARKALQEKWMPSYRGSWNWSTNLPKATLLNGTMSSGSPTWNGRLPAEKVEMIYTNCVIDDLRITEDSTSPNRMKYEMRVLFDTHWERWAADSNQTTATRYLRFIGGTAGYGTETPKENQWDSDYPLLAPTQMPNGGSGAETAPASYIGPYTAQWSE